jgi:hypothetical protein
MYSSGFQFAVDATVFHSSTTFQQVLGATLCYAFAFFKLFPTRSWCCLLRLSGGFHDPVGSTFEQQVCLFSYTLFNTTFLTSSNIFHHVFDVTPCVFSSNKPSLNIKYPLGNHDGLVWKLNLETIQRFLVVKKVMQHVLAAALLASAVNFQNALDANVVIVVWCPPTPSSHYAFTFRHCFCEAGALSGISGCSLWPATFSFLNFRIE